MSERVDLTVPDQTEPGTTHYSVASLFLSWEAKSITIVLLGENNERKQVVYDDNTGATALMNGLNKADLSVKSLHKRIMERLLSDGHLAGTISGTPD